MINWKKYFDHIYTVNFVNNKLRQINLNNELKRVGILDSGIYDTIEFIPSPLINQLCDMSLDVSNVMFDSFTKYKMYNMLINHYFIIKQAYLKGYKKVLVLEDDVRFLKDINYIEKLLDKSINIFNTDKPTILLGSSSWTIDSGKYYNCDYADKYYDSDIVLVTNRNLAGTGFNVYNKEAMKQLIDFVESNKFAVIDQYWLIYNDDTDIYIMPKHICLQEDWIGQMVNCHKDYQMNKVSMNQLISYMGWIQKKPIYYDLYNSIIDYMYEFNYSNDEIETIRKLYIG